MKITSISRRESHERDYWRLLRRLRDPWKKRHMRSWFGFKRGIAWVLLYGGVPAKISVRFHGMIDEWPYHISMCEIVSMDPTAILTHGRNGKREWWKLRASRTKRNIWYTAGTPGRVQTVYRKRRQAA